MTFRFSARTLLLAVAYAALALSALLAGSALWANVLFNVTLVALLVATLNAVFTRGPSRSFWGGFAIVGWAYAMVTFGPWFTNNVAGRLLTTESLKPLQQVLAPIQASRELEPGYTLRQSREDIYQTGPNAIFSVWGGSWQNTRRIGHSVWTLMLAVVGGWWAQRVATRRTDGVQKPA